MLVTKQVWKIVQWKIVWKNTNSMKKYYESQRLPATVYKHSSNDLHTGLEQHEGEQMMNLIIYLFFLGGGGGASL